MTARTLSWLLKGLAVLVLLYVVGYLGIWQWMICRVEVPPGQSLRLRYRGPFPFGGVASVQARGGRPSTTDPKK